MGGSPLGDRSADNCDDTFEVSQNIVVPESNDPEVLAFEPARSGIVPGFLICMLAAIDFDDKPGAVTDEVDDVAAKRNLPAEPQAVHLLSPQN